MGDGCRFQPFIFQGVTRQKKGAAPMTALLPAKSGPQSSPPTDAATWEIMGSQGAQPVWCIYLPRTQMTIVLIGKGLVLGG